LAGVVYATVIASRGVPVLRHDWSWPAERGDVFDLLMHSLSPWDPRGIGSPNLYINDYVIGALASLLAFACGPQAGLWAFSAAIGTTCAAGGAVLAKRMGSLPLGQCAAGVICLFNPWVYAETVAGHVYMVLAYGALAGIAAECLRRNPRPAVVSLLVVLTLEQLQLFVVAAVMIAALFAFRRIWLPVVTAAIVATPLLAIVILEYPSFQRVPFSLQWESVQSVAPTSALALTGYFAGYTQQIDALDLWAMLCVVALALYGFSTIIRARRTIAFVVLGALSIVVAVGFRGPLVSFERYALTTLPAFRLFRELFDVLACAAVAYCAGVGAAARTLAGAAPAALLGCVLVTSWLVWSPWQWWVSSYDLPTAPKVTVPAGTRYALLPAFQPLVFGQASNGSGLDPNAKIRFDDVNPINTISPDYPVDTALAALEQRDDARRLEALGVSTIIDRPWLKTDDATITKQRALGSTAARIDTALSRAQAVTPQSELSLAPIPPVCAVCTRIDADAVFFGDVAGMRGPTVPAAWEAYRRPVAVAAPGDDVQADRGWVDARLAFAARPELGQPFGGAMTTSAKAALPVTSRTDILVDVQGELVAASGAIIARTTQGYRWVPLPAGIDSLRCLGLCVVALEGSRPKDVPAEAGASASTVPVSGTTAAPWLEFVDVPRGPTALLRFNVAYDHGWAAFAALGPLAHVRTDAIVNGWLLPARATGTRIILVHWPSVLASLLELGAACWIVYLIMLRVRSFERRDDEAARERRT
jgi:hypothetical protein